jgi:hypothetical protein
MKKQQLTCMALLCSVLWAGCSGHKSVSSADSTAIITSLDTNLKAAKLVKTADMRFKVRDVKATGEGVSALTAKYKGMVMHHSMRSVMNRDERLPLTNDSLMLVSSYNTDADMVVKIPAADVDDFMNQVGHMAVYINNRNMDIQDRTLDYLSAQMKLISRTAIIDQQKKGIVKIKNPADVMNLKDDLIDQQIDNKRIDQEVKYSTVGLNFYQNNTVAREVVVNDDPSTFKLPFITRMGQAFANGWAIFTDCVIGLANLWMFVLAALAGWFAYKYYKKKQAIALG